MGDPGKTSKNIENIYPLSAMQEGLLFHTLLHPGSGVYLMQDRYLLEGTLDRTAFRRAWQQVVDRHCVLRTSFVWENQKRPLQVVHKQVAAPIVELDWRDRSPAQQERDFDALLQEELRTGFDFAQVPVFRIRLIQMTENTYRITRSYHLILMDAWCLSLLMVDFFSFYESLIQGQERQLEKPRLYKDYISWLQKQDPVGAEQFWRKELQGFDAPTLLAPTYTAREESEAGADVADQTLTLSPALTGSLTELARKHQLTLNTLIQGAWARVVGEYTGQTDVVFGVTVAGRPPELDGVESMVGLFINSLPLRVSVDPGTPVLTWMKFLLAQNVQMRQYEYAPLVQIQGWSDVPRGRALFDSLLVFENVPVDPLLTKHAFPFRAQQEGNRTHTNYPLTVVIILGAELGLQLSYNRWAFTEETIVGMLQHFHSILAQMAKQPEGLVGDLVMLTDAERTTREKWNETGAMYPAEASVADLFEAQAGRTPDATAARCGTDTVTFADLNRRAEQVAQVLAAEGVGPETVVALLVTRGIELLVMILAVLKAGGAYLPLDPHHPASRWRQILTQGRVRVLLTTEEFQPRMAEVIEPGGMSRDLRVLTTESSAHARMAAPRPSHRTCSTQVAYTIFTSGSTGVPKGAMVTQQGMVNNVWGKIPTLGLTVSDVVAQTASHCFDISVWQLLSALLCGARVEILTDDIVRDPPRLLAELARTGVTVAELVPSLLREVVMVEPPVALPALRWLLPTGEAITPELCRTWFAQHPTVPLLNAYGPAECADDVAYFTLKEALPADELVVPIGKPAANLQLYVLNSHLQHVPIGVTGEICVGGIGVGRGYLQDSTRTAVSFVPHPYAQQSGDRLYRTGDLGRYRADGNIEFLGRRDQQVKVRGYRIELGEIEAALAAQPGVRDQVVIVREDRPGHPQLIAYVVYDGEQPVDILRPALRTLLPDYMVPATVIALEMLPLTPNGKIDRNALPKADHGAQHDERYEAPQTPTEEVLAGIWAELLGLPRVGRHDKFFDLGGHSLLAVQLLSRMRKTFKVELTLRDLFEVSTVAEASVRIEEYLIEQLEGLSESEAQSLLIGRN